MVFLLCFCCYFWGSVCVYVVFVVVILCLFVCLFCFCGFFFSSSSSYH